ncbi:hypothetical protein [Rhodococcoides kyotonense]|uniref:IrrE N-terminal-like domain-containing protein n=1 Tax=Rhodococcoides kyotonense TaxID=398843 RepID=A0A177YE08_9NOCA|nr:hypothetical protein [Rhodococcus kyotonensis]OAK53786.1 hypothetical protein A3K89_21940 [Rhodococcus kyotonensis]
MGSAREAAAAVANIGDPQLRASAFLDVLDLPFNRPWSIDRFVAEVGFEIDRVIVVLDLPDDLSASGEVSGFWVRTAPVDVIYVRKGEDPLFREQCILHELAHILLGHEADTAVIEAILKETFMRMAPDIPIEMVNALVEEQRNKVCFTRVPDFLQPIELEAEWLGTVMLDRADALRKPFYPEGIDPKDEETLRRVATIFGWQM